MRGKQPILGEVLDVLREIGADKLRVAANGPTIVTVIAQANNPLAQKHIVRNAMIVADMVLDQVHVSQHHELRVSKVRSKLKAAMA